MVWGLGMEGKSWVREHRPLISLVTYGYGQSGLGLFIFLEKLNG